MAVAGISDIGSWMDGVSAGTAAGGGEGEEEGGRGGNVPSVLYRILHHT